MAEISVRPATNSDIVRFAGWEAAELFFRTYTDWDFQVAERNGAIISMAGFVWDKHGDCWAFVDSDGYRMKKTLQANVIKALSTVGNALDVVYTYLDDTKPTAERWLRRLGFRYSCFDGDLGMEVWAWQRSAQS